MGGIDGRDERRRLRERDNRLGLVGGGADGRDPLTMTSSATGGNGLRRQRAPRCLQLDVSKEFIQTASDSRERTSACRQPDSVRSAIEMHRRLISACNFRMTASHMQPVAEIEWSEAGSNCN